MRHACSKILHERFNNFSMVGISSYRADLTGRCSQVVGITFFFSFSLPCRRDRRKQGIDIAANGTIDGHTVVCMGSVLAWCLHASWSLYRLSCPWRRWGHADDQAKRQNAPATHGGGHDRNNARMVRERMQKRENKAETEISQNLGGIHAGAIRLGTRTPLSERVNLIY